MRRWWSAFAVVVSVLFVAIAQPANAVGLGHFGFIRDTAPDIIRVARFDGSSAIDSSDPGFNAPQFGKDGRVFAEATDGIRLIRRFHAGAAGRKIPGTKPGDEFPAPSPDGKKLVLYSPTDGLMLMHFGSTKRFMLASTAGVSNRIARFSRDSKFVFFEENTGQIERLNTATGVGIPMTSDGVDGCPCRQQDLSPDGTLIVFKRGTSDIVVKPVSPPQSAALTVITTSGDTPIFSPDSKYVAYVSTGTGKITIEPADGSNSFVLTTPIVTGLVFDWRS